MSTEPGQLEDFVAEKMLAGWSKRAIKSPTRDKFGPQQNSDLECYIREAKEKLSVAVETESEMSSALDLYRRWTTISNLVNAQLISRDRLHRSLNIPPPAEMLRLQRDWGESAPTAIETVQQVAKQLTELRQVIESKNNPGLFL